MITQKELIHMYYAICDIEEEIHINPFPHDKILSLTEDFKKDYINRVDDAPQ
tara:strand:- start:2779 stop:2934 length:156 start_codon:yes stop_codon:yes gene_type:complete